MNVPVVHLICNTHIDPVWLWGRLEGKAEVISTFRTAVELCEKDENLIFNQGEAILYEWVQELDPKLFLRIKRLIALGKWNIVGGWYLLPDCNMPSGESIVRQVLYGKNYFMNNFGVDVTLGFNPDSFGHSRGIVQILAKSGFDSYLFGRPNDSDCPLPLNGDAFVWAGYDGSKVLATRFTGWYSSRLGQAREKVEKWLDENGHKRFAMILWGVGNHGGGPSRKDLSDINSLIGICKHRTLLHSTPQKYFDELKCSISELETYSHSLNRWAVGCYSSMARIKKNHRLLENEIFAAEKMLTTAACYGLIDFPKNEFHEAIRNLMFIQHHDILPGTCVKAAESEALRVLGHARDIIANVREKAFLALVHDERKSEGTLPYFVYNHHPYKVRTTIEAEYTMSDEYRNGSATHAEVEFNGKIIPSQIEKEDCYWPAEWRKRIVFEVDLLPGQVNRFDFHVKKGLPEETKSRIKETPKKYVFEGENLTFAINKETGYVDTYVVNDKAYLTDNAFLPIVMQDCEDPWLMQNDSFCEKAGSFVLYAPENNAFTCSAGNKSVQVIEEGPIRSVIECLYIYGSSTICQRFKLPTKGSEVEVEMSVFWNEKDCALKLEVPTLFKKADCLTESMFGFENICADGKENAMQKWASIISHEHDSALTIINDGVYGVDFQEGRMRFTLLRGAAYAAGRFEEKQNPKVQGNCSARLDQGEHCFKFWLNAGNVQERMGHVSRESLIKNEGLCHCSFFPDGKGRDYGPLVVLDDESIIMSALKINDNNNVIIRLFEPTGIVRNVKLSFPFFNKKFNIKLQNFEIKTLCFCRDSGTLEDVNLLEKILT
jgi:alpha-mannosidase